MNREDLGAIARVIIGSNPYMVLGTANYTSRSWVYPRRTTRYLQRGDDTLTGAWANPAAVATRELPPRQIDRRQGEIRSQIASRLRLPMQS
jgi:hypothetical protein